MDKEKKRRILRLFAVCVVLIYFFIFYCAFSGIVHGETRQRRAPSYFISAFISVPPSGLTVRKWQEPSPNTAVIFSLYSSRIS